MRPYLKNLIGMIGMLLITSALIVVFSIVFRRLKRDSDSAISAQNEVALYEHNESAWVAAKQTVANDKTTLATLQSYIVTPDTVPPFLSALESLAARADVEFSLSGVSTDAINKTPALSITFSGTGSKAALTTFVHSIEMLPQQISFTSFLLAESTDEPVVKGSTGLWQVDARIRVLSFVK